MRFVVFPHSRNAGMLDRVARAMAAKGSIDAAQEELAFILEVIADKLERLGVADADIDHECHSLARAAWQRWQQLQLEAGAA
ncbi:DUF6074 family protein [Bradyrhizobium sp. cf659]|uniref:DUF6074 family protein n=1 Tax=Bradyrhizobium sp. cf659 TaxID=1761771 RepID=UPI0008F3F95E|nr:hypothetical protein SAMN04487925_10164 [Bradyrhizobium sp. cf659]